MGDDAEYSIKLKSSADNAGLVSSDSAVQKLTESTKKLAVELSNLEKLKRGIFDQPYTGTISDSSVSSSKGLGGPGAIVQTSGSGLASTAFAEQKKTQLESTQADKDWYDKQLENRKQLEKVLLEGAQRRKELRDKEAQDIAAYREKVVAEQQKVFDALKEQDQGASIPESFQKQ